jgi:hypothetical protein
MPSCRTSAILLHHELCYDTSNQRGRSQSVYPLRRANAPGVTCGRRTGIFMGVTSIEAAGNIAGRNELGPAAVRFTPPLGSRLMLGCSLSRHSTDNPRTMCGRRSHLPLNSSQRLRSSVVAFRSGPQEA